MTDTVAKVFLHHRLQIFRALRASYGDELTGDFGNGLEAISYRSAISARLVYLREIARTAF
jgi:hypothetical protein